MTAKQHILMPRRLRRNLKEVNLTTELCIMEAYSEIMEYIAGAQLSVRQAHEVAEMVIADLEDRLDSNTVTWAADPVAARLWGDN